MFRFVMIILFFAFAASNTAAEKTLHSSLPFPDTLSIQESDTTEYEILIIETGYENWMATNARPKWYYSNEYYRNKNRFFVIDWNNRVLETMHTPPFEDRIEYNPHIDYGLDVNYKLYWYFKFMEHKYGINLRGSGKDR
jgi:hypothetical protein